MPLTNLLDSDEAKHRRANQGDPLVQYIVVRRERVTGLESLLAAVARAVAKADDHFGLQPEWGELYEAWRKQSFRKVTLRANEKDWPKLLNQFDAVTYPDDADAEPIVAVLPPRPRSQVTRFLAGLQAYVLDPQELPRESQSSTDEPVMLLAINPELTMSLGKIAAQVGHAVLLCSQAQSYLGADHTWSEAARIWRQANMPVRIVTPSSAGWNRLLASDTAVVVTDAGLTEIEAGSQAVLALRPAAGEELRQNLSLAD